jgi:hypothetical protein
MNMRRGKEGEEEKEYDDDDDDDNDNERATPLQIEDISSNSNGVDKG